LEIVDKVIQQKIFSPLKGYLMLLPINKHPLINTFEKEKLTSRSNITTSRSPSPTKISPQVKSLTKKVPSSLKAKKESAPQNIPPSPSFQKKVAPPVKPQAKKPETRSNIPFPNPESQSASTEKEETFSPLPEPAEVGVKKAEIKTTRLKNFSVSPQYRKKAAEIKNKLLAAMKKRMAPPKVVEVMKQLSQKGWKNIKKSSLKKKKKAVKLDAAVSSQVFSGEKGKFAPPEKKNVSEKKPFIFNVKLKKEKREAEVTKEEKPIPYSKYKPTNPFGNA